MKPTFVRLVTCLFFGLILCALDGQAQSLCSKQVSISKLIGVLYKSENPHGNRGPTLLIQNAAERPGKSRLEVRDVLCRKISSFGLYSTDWPYGARYYQRSGGSKHTAKQLYALAMKAGSSNILVEGKKGKWIVIKNPLQREGEVFSD